MRSVFLQNRSRPPEGLEDRSGGTTTAGLSVDSTLVDAPKPPRRGGTLPLVIAVALIVLILVTLGATSPRPPLVEVLPRPTPTATLGPEVPLPSLNPLPSQSPVYPMPDVEPLVLPGWADDVVRILAAVALLALIGTFLYRLSGELIRTERRHAAEPTGAESEIPEIDDEELVEALDETVAELRLGMAVDGAVIACWRRLEQAAVSSGIFRKPAQTSQEFTVEVLSRAVVDAAALEELAELYRQAMFSTHELTDAHRDRAVSALEALSAQLSGRAAP